MEQITDIEEARNKVLSDMQALLSQIRSHSEQNITRVDDGATFLRKLRSTVYENMNQIQHEFLLLKAMEWLLTQGYKHDDRWEWNPRQTGGIDEPDLRVRKGDNILLCAEATTSEKPVGVIDQRMKKTLTKLSEMKGEKFYFVKTDKMKQRAKTKIENNGWAISVVKIN